MMQNKIDLDELEAATLKFWSGEIDMEAYIAAASPAVILELIRMAREKNAS